MLRHLRRLSVAIDEVCNTLNPEKLLKKNLSYTSSPDEQAWLGIG